MTVDSFEFHNLTSIFFGLKCILNKNEIVFSCNEKKN